ncbi:MAG: hypothetical protein LC635_05075 [Pseudonocardiaceae bacterium]|nr:hypothetical protein [Pseudonocardiaceae bacterium]
METEPMLVDRNPLPIAGRLGQQLAFLIEVDRLKTVLRASTLASVERRGVTAETVRTRTAHIGEASAALGDAMTALVDGAERNGWLASP